MRACRNRRPRSEAGFTLMELLVALTLMAMLMTAMLGGLRLGARVWEASGDRLEANDRLAAVRGFLRQRLEDASPASETDGEATSRPLFQGEPSKLRLASSMPASLGQGLFLMELSLRSHEDGDGTKDLVLRWRSWPDIVDGVEERALLDDVAGLKLGYFSRAEGERVGRWRDSWPDQRLMPELVRIDLQFPANDPRRWQPLIVSPMIDEWYDTTF
ncbi:MAG: prepilin-type N-terminal cleavage/methylation domain-containing protein [Alphaproteobacteria bacterium]